jgi:hypothetical protein
MRKLIPVEDTPKVEPNPEEQRRMPSRKEMRATMMPKVGDVVEGSRVVYVNNGKFRFTAENSNNLPVVGTTLVDTGRIYQVDYLIPEKSRFCASFKGFKDYAVAPEAPINIEDDIVKVI